MRRACYFWDCWAAWTVVSAQRKLAELGAAADVGCPALAVPGTDRSGPLQLFSDPNRVRIISGQAKAGPSCCWVPARCPCRPSTDGSVWKACAPGETRLYSEEQGFVPEFCGGYQLTVCSAWVSDYLGLFLLPVFRRGRMRLLVRPQPKPIEDLPGLPPENCVNWQPSRSAYGESYELRPYRPGDSLNRVHWKLSAKTGALTVRRPRPP